MKVLKFPKDINTNNILSKTEGREAICSKKLDKEVF